MHFVPLRAVFLHQGSRKGHRLRPTGHSVSGTWMHLKYERHYGLGMDGLVMGCSQHERYYSLDMDVLVIGYSGT